MFKDDDLNQIDFDDKKILNDEKFLSEDLPIDNDTDWEYLKKTVHSKDGKYISDDFIRYHQITDKLVDDEDTIVNMHMNIIKEDAKMLTEEGELITNIKGIGDDVNFEMETYATKLEKIIERKIKVYSELKSKIEEYK